MNAYQEVGPDQLNGCRVVDVRNYDEYERVHIQGAECVPLPQLLRRASQWNPEEAIVLICQEGPRSKQAAEQLLGAGFQDVSIVSGGTSACVSAGVGVVRGRGPLPLQRQVLIGAGGVILSGLVGALFYPPLIGVSWFAGAMLVLAGLTGFCPMAKLLAWAPWNASRGCDSKCSA